ncbi:MAG: DUF4342 domain-containing protein [Bacteroidota bacterium]
MSNHSVTDKAKAATSEAFEEIKLAGNQLVDRVRELVEEGNVRHIRIKKEERVLLEIPLTVGIGAGAAAVLLSPVLAAVGALAALLTDVTLEVERDLDEATGEPTETPASKPTTDTEKTIGK